MGVEYVGLKPDERLPLTIENVLMFDARVLIIFGAEYAKRFPYSTKPTIILPEGISDKDEALYEKAAEFIKNNFQGTVGIYKEKNIVMAKIHRHLNGEIINEGYRKHRNNVGGYVAVLDRFAVCAMPKPSVELTDFLKAHSISYDMNDGQTIIWLPTANAGLIKALESVRNITTVAYS